MTCRRSKNLVHTAMNLQRCSSSRCRCNEKYSYSFCHVQSVLVWAVGETRTVATVQKYKDFMKVIDL
jgi:hypothetical protein